MSNLIENLQSIYQTKLQIKEVIETQSDVFSEYPQLIEAAIEGGGGEQPSGYAYISANGDWNIRSYEMVNVNVPVPSGYIIPTGTYNITENGTGIDITNYAYVDINVPTGGAAVLGYTTITTNGTTYASTFDLDGFSYVNVAVPTSGGTTYTLIDDVSDISASDQLVTATVVSTADNYATYITPEMAQHYPLYEHFVGTYVSDKAKLNGTEILFAAAQYFGKGTYMCNATTYIMNMGGSNMYCLTAGDNLRVGGVPASGTYNINTNGTFDISSYQYCSVSVPEPIVAPSIFMQEQFGDLGYFSVDLDGDQIFETKYYVTGNYKFGYQYEATLTPYYNDNKTPMIYNVVNVVEIGMYPDIQTYTETRYYYADSYHHDTISYGYGSNRNTARYYFSANAEETPYNPEMYLLPEANTAIANLTGGEQLSITYILNGTWKLVVSVEVVNS